MPPSDKPIQEKSVQQVVEDLGLYPPEAYAFIQQGLSFTVQKLHGKVKDPKANRHVSGPDLCEGLREMALSSAILMHLSERDLRDLAILEPLHSLDRFLFARK